MKLMKSELKSIVKECLIEILKEGLGGSLGTQTTIIDNAKGVFAEKKIDKVVPRRPTPQLKEAIRREAGGNKIMESIFADTARTTLAEQSAFGEPKSVDSGRPGISQQEQIKGTPEQVFGEEVTSKWADLAFMNSPTKK